MEQSHLNPKEVVLTLIKDLNTENFEDAQSRVADDFSFEGVMGSRNGAEAYFSDMKKMKLKYDIKNVFAEGDDICILYDLEMQGKKIFCCGLYHVKDAKVNSLKVVFDPRPVL
ncbi:MAG: nuclear transport factor 2 family protein [Cyclobacteriaceae bacterium]|nr:nuclear transport factor 2 family protein [Cyclobacteriaceae bacterium]